MKWLRTAGGAASTSALHFAGTPWWALLTMLILAGMGIALEKILKLTFPQKSDDRLAMWQGLFRLLSQHRHNRDQLVGRHRRPRR